VYIGRREVDTNLSNCPILKSRYLTHYLSKSQTNTFTNLRNKQISTLEEYTNLSNCPTLMTIWNALLRSSNMHIELLAYGPICKELQPKCASFKLARRASPRAAAGRASTSAAPAARAVSNARASATEQS
jgi:hypothetical protein